MQRIVTASLLTTALLITPLLAAPAEARHDSGFSVGGWFSIGGIHFSLVFGSRGGHPDYYYRTDDRFQYRGHRCTDRCYRDRGYSYHSLDCPVVGYHMDRYHQRPHMLFRGYAPAPFWRGAFYGDGHGSWGHHDRDRYYDRRYGRYDRHGRYDRYDRYDRHGRYDRHDRGRHRGRHDRHRGRGRGHHEHRHDAYCGHDWRHQR